MIKLSFTSILLLIALVFNGQTKRNIMSSKYSEAYLKKVLTDPEKWFPEPGYPTQDRWKEIPSERRDAIAKK